MDHHPDQPFLFCLKREPRAQIDGSCFAAGQEEEIARIAGVENDGSTFGMAPPQLEQYLQ